jgi:hypothetical protein
MSQTRSSPLGNRHKTPDPRPGTDGLKIGLVFSITASGVDPPQPESITTLITTMKQLA